MSEEIMLGFSAGFFLTAGLVCLIILIYNPFKKNKKGEKVFMEDKKITEFEKLQTINHDLQEHNVYAYQLELAHCVDNEEDYQTVKSVYEDSTYGLSEVVDAVCRLKTDNQKVKLTETMLLEYLKSNC